MESNTPSDVINMYIVYIVKLRDTFTKRRALTLSENQTISNFIYYCFSEYAKEN